MARVVLSVPVDELPQWLEPHLDAVDAALQAAGEDEVVVASRREGQGENEIVVGMRRVGELLVDVRRGARIFKLPVGRLPPIARQLIDDGGHVVAPWPARLLVTIDEAMVGPGVYSIVMRGDRSWS
jgi:hypothetical protein